MSAEKVIALVVSIVGGGGFVGIGMLIRSVIKDYKNQLKEEKEKLKTEIEEKTKFKITVDALHTRVDDMEKEDGRCDMGSRNAGQLQDHEIRIRKLEEAKIEDAEFKGTINAQMKQVVGLQKAMDSKLDKLIAEKE